MSTDVNLSMGPAAAAALSLASMIALAYFELRVRPLLVAALEVYREREEAAEKTAQATEKLASAVYKLAGKAA